MQLSGSGLNVINDYAAGIGPTRDLIIPRPGNVIGAPTTLVADAHAAGLLVHPFTFRAENTFLSNGYRVGSNPNAYGNCQDETILYLKLGIDRFFTDQADYDVRAVNAVAVVPEPSTFVLVARWLRSDCYPLAASPLLIDEWCWPVEYRHR